MALFLFLSFYIFTPDLETHVCVQSMSVSKGQGPGWPRKILPVLPQLFPGSKPLSSTHSLGSLPHVRLQTQSLRDRAGPY